MGNTCAPRNDIKNKHGVMTDECSARLGDDGWNGCALLLADLLHSANDAAGIVLHICQMCSVLLSEGI